jgi:hypothetical protein
LTEACLGVGELVGVCGCGWGLPGRLHLLEVGWLAGRSGAQYTIRKDGKFRGSDGSGRACLARLGSACECAWGEILCAGVSRVTVALNLNARRHHARSVEKEGPQAGCHSRSFTKRKIDPTPVPVSILLSFPWLLAPGGSVGGWRRATYGLTSPQDHTVGSHHSHP